MGIVDELISSQGSELLGSLTGQAGFSAQQAEKFLPAATEQVVTQVKGGGFDLTSLLGGGGAASLISKLDVAGLASQAGIPESLASGGLQALVPVLLSALQSKAGGAEGILSLLGGGDDAGGALGAVGKLAGGFFKR